MRKGQDMDAAMAVPTRRLDMWYAGVAPQRRLTVLFRLILLIPQFIVLIFIGIALVIVAVIGWFAALFMGRLPGWAHRFISDVLRWLTRVDAYIYLLTDRYPPFTFEDREYPVRPFFPEPGRLNRWTVFFRFFLALPASIFAEIVRYGLTAPLILVTWFIVLITGRMPPRCTAPIRRSCATRSEWARTSICSPRSTRGACWAIAWLRWPGRTCPRPVPAPRPDPSLRRA